MNDLTVRELALAIVGGEAFTDEDAVQVAKALLELLEEE